MKKILIIYGSHRQNSQTKVLLDTLLAPLNLNADIKKIHVADLQVNHCLACLACSKTGFCVLQDDMNKLYLAMEESDAVIVVSPIYFNHLPSRLKQVIDRFEPYFFRKLKLNMPPKPKRFFVLLSSGVKLKFETKSGVWSTLDLLTKSFNGTLNEPVFIEETDRYNMETLQMEHADDLALWSQALVAFCKVQQ